MTDRGIRWLSLGFVAALGLYSVARLEMTTSITHFIPASHGTELVDVTLDLVNSALSRRMVLTISGGQERIRAAADLAEELRSHPEVAWVESGFDERAVRATYELYFDRRSYMVSKAPRIEIPAMMERASLDHRASELLEQLARPDSSLVSRTAPADPLGFFGRTIDRIRSFQPTPPGDAEAQGGAGHAVIFLGLKSSPFDSVVQAKLLNDIVDTFARIDAAHGGGLTLEQSGVNRFAVAAEKTVRSDANFISALSIPAVCAIFLLVFRSPRSLFVAFLTPLCGFFAALTLTTWSSPVLHGITLAFGFVLLGVAIDYPIHVMNHHALSGAATPRESVSRIRPSLVFSGLTTTLAFLVLALSEFPGLGEMGMFAAIGVPVSLAFTLFVTPSFLPPRAHPSRLQRIASDRLADWIQRLHARPLLPVGVFGAFAAIAVMGIPELRWEDDPAALMPLDPVLLAEAERVRGRSGVFEGGRFVVGLAPDAESALALNDRIYARLERAVAGDELVGFTSLHSFLWSEALQRENLLALQEVPSLRVRIDRAFTAKGFRPGAFDGFTSAVASPVAEPLRPVDFVGSPLERVLDFLIELDGRWAVVTSVQGVRSGAGIRKALDGLDGAHYLDQKEVVAELYKSYRRSTLRTIAVGCLVVFIVLLLRYRRLLPGVLAAIPSALAALATLGFFGLTGTPVNVVSAISLLVVLGMGVDYGIFAVDSARHPERQGVTLSSLAVSCLTSLFVFGILALSHQPVLRSIGQTTATGIVIALLLAPAVMVLARRGFESGRSGA